MGRPFWFAFFVFLFSLEGYIQQCDRLEEEVNFGLISLAILQGFIIFLLPLIKAHATINVHRA
ncbi:MAG: hypothetical protein ACKO4S_03220 [Snowella sp.]|nr:MAG: hypothetical protein DCF12_18475 [Snowella sp.]